MRDNIFADRVRGCLLGGAAGDALGYPVEFQSEASIFKRYGQPGITSLADAAANDQSGVALISDDTQMTLFAANALVWQRFNGGGVRDALWLGYREWLGTQGDRSRMEDKNAPRMWLYSIPAMHALRAPGNTCLSAIRGTRRGGTPDHPANNSKGCGTVMRAAPFGLAWREGEALTREEALHRVSDAAIADAALTHGHPLAYGSSAALAMMVYEAVNHRGDYSDLADLIIRVQAHLSDEDYGRPNLLLDRAIELSAKPGVSDLDGIHALGEGWVAEEALAIAVFCALRHPDDFAAALIAAVNHKGDSDSTGAVCGNLLGAWLGQSAVEAAFDLNQLELRDVILTMADDLIQCGAAACARYLPLREAVTSTGDGPAPELPPLKPLRKTGILYTPATTKALDICFKAHQDQRDKSGAPYVFHPFHVAEQLESEDEICAALLHDVVEDGYCTLEELSQEGFSKTVMKALNLLTHREGVPYMDYVTALRTNPVARRVKLADLSHNSDIGRIYPVKPGERPRLSEVDAARLRKYRIAQAILADDRYDPRLGLFVKRIPLDDDGSFTLCVRYARTYNQIHSYALENCADRDQPVVFSPEAGKRLRKALDKKRSLAEGLADCLHEKGPGALLMAVAAAK